MDVIPDAGAVPGGIVVAVNRHMVPPSVGNLQNNGDQVGLRVMRLADLTGHMRAAGVEVAQRHKPDAVGNGRPVEHPLHGELRLAVAVRRVGGVGLQNRHMLRLAVGRRRGGKDDVLYPMLDHGLQHRPGAAQIVIVVFQGIDHTLAHLRIRREVDDRVDLLGGKHMVAEFLTADIALIESGLRMHRLAKTGFQIIGHDHVVAVVNEFIHGVAANVARAAKYQNRFHLYRLFSPQ